MVNTSPITTTEIGNMVLDWLKTLDPLAYMRFASVYKDFESLNDLKKELLADPEVNLAYKELGSEYDIIRQVIKARVEQILKN